MFRKSTMLILALVAVLSSFACNSSIVGPTTTSSSDGSDRGPRQPVQTDKLPCDDGARDVRIVTPYDAQILHVGDLVSVAFEASNFCTGYSAQVRVSYDNGGSWTTLADQKNISLVRWRVTAHAGHTARIEVTLTDDIGSVSDTVQMSSVILEAPGPNPNDPPQQDG